MALAQFADVHATVLDAGEVVLTEGHNVQVLSARSSVEDRSVLVVAVQLEDRQASIHKLLIAELVTGDLDLGVGAGLTVRRDAWTSTSQCTCCRR